MNGETVFQNSKSGEKAPGLSNGLRYPLVGGTRERQFAGTNLKPRKRPENAQTPISRVHAVLAGLHVYKSLALQSKVFVSNQNCQLFSSALNTFTNCSP